MNAMVLGIICIAKQSRFILIASMILFSNSKNEEINLNSNLNLLNIC